MKKCKLYIMMVLVALMLISSFIVYGYDDSSFERLSSALQSTTTYGTHYLYIQPDTSSRGRYNLNTSKSGFKFFCQGDVYVYVTGSTPYGTITYNLKFDPEILHNIGGVINSNVLDSMPNSNFVPNYNNLYNQHGQSTTPRVGGYLSKFSFTPWTGRTQMWIDICDDEGNYCTPTPNSDKNHNEAYSAHAGGSNSYLEGVKGAIYDLYAWPCTPDTTKPTITGTLDNKVYTGVKNLTGLIYDRSTNNTTTLWNYWFNGHNYSETGVNYVQYDNSQTRKIDNQEGIDSTTISVSISCPGCGWSQATQSLTPTNTGNAGTTDRNVKTWDNHDRGYLVQFTTPELKLEKQTTVTLSGCDRPNETGATHCQTKTFTFNKSTNPSVTSGYNTNGTGWRENNVFPSSSNEYMIIVSDNPAGINSGSITITFNAAEDLSGNTTPTVVLSGSDLTISNSGVVTDYGVRTVYEVRFHPPYDLLEGTQTRMDVYVEDIVENHTTKTFNLNTRAACSTFGGCRDYLNINHFGDTMGNEFTRLFSGLNIVVTGDINSIYPYLDGDVLYCGLPFDGAELVSQGAMNLYQYGNASVQTGLMLSTPNKYVREAANSADVNHDFGRDENNRNMIKDISVY